jgi:hypothetical protein
MRTPAKSTVETPLLPLFGQFQKGYLLGNSEGIKRAGAELDPGPLRKTTVEQMTSHLAAATVD